MEEFFLAFFGLPLHPLAVHFAVVFFPIALIIFLIVLLTPRFRERLTLWAALLLAATTPTVLLAQQSGLALAKVLYSPSPHSALGNTLVIIALLTAGVAVLVGWSFRRSWNKILQRILGLSAVTMAIASIALTIAVGHSGSGATWGGVLP